MTGSEQEIVSRRFGSRHDKPCMRATVLECTKWQCQVRDRCELDERPIAQVLKFPSPPESP